jgi:hypothetical protein
MLDSSTLAIAVSVHPIGQTGFSKGFKLHHRRTEFLAFGTFVAYTFSKLSALAEVVEMPPDAGRCTNASLPQKVQE